MEQGLAEFLHHLENSVENPQAQALRLEAAESEAESEEAVFRLRSRDKQRLEELFENAAKDRSQAYALKQELDRLKVFHDYEDRFLDLFKEPD